MTIGLHAQRRAQATRRTDRRAGMLLAALAVVALALAPFARPAPAYVQSASGAWLPVSALGFLCLPGKDGTPPPPGAGGHLLCGLCTLAAGGAGCPPSAPLVPPPAPIVRARIPLPAPTVPRPAGRYQRPRTRAPPRSSTARSPDP